MSKKSFTFVISIIVALALIGPFVATSSDESKAEQQTPSVDRASITAKRFLETHVSSDGRVGPTATSFREQSLGLLIAAATADRERVDAIWARTKQDLTLADTTFARSRVSNQAPSGMADAADLMTMARGFLVAAVRLEDASYKEPASTLANSVLATRYREISPGEATLVDADSAVLYSLTDIEAFVREFRDSRWSALRARAIRAAKALVEENEAVLPLENGLYGGEARVVPLELASSCDPAATEVATKLWIILRQSRERRLANALGQEGDVVDAVQSPQSAVASSAAAKAAGEKLQSLQLLDQADSLDTAGLVFDDSVGTAIGRIMLTTDWLGSCTS